MQSRGGAELTAELLAPVTNSAQPHQCVGLAGSRALGAAALLPRALQPLLPLLPPNRAVGLGGACRCLPVPAVPLSLQPRPWLQRERMPPCRRRCPCDAGGRVLVARRAATHNLIYVCNDTRFGSHVGLPRGKSRRNPRAKQARVLARILVGQAYGTLGAAT